MVKNSSGSLTPSPLTPLPQNGGEGKIEQREIRERRQKSKASRAHVPKATQRARDLRVNATEAEKKLWQCLRQDQLGVRFRRQHPIGPYITDFCCPEKMLVIEVDGGQHNENTKDEKRDEFLTSKGFTVYRFWNNEVMENIEGVVFKIMEKIKSPSLGSRAARSFPLPLGGEGLGERGQKEQKNMHALRNDFPMLKTQMNGKPLVFLDSAASAQKPYAVIEAMNDVQIKGYSNIHRGLYKISQDLTQIFEDVRAKMARFIGAPSANNIVFTRNSTESINLVAQSWGRRHLKAGDEIILSVMEHHANIVPWQLLQDQIGIVIKVIPMQDDGALDLEAYQKLLSPKTRLVSVVHISNALGTINPAAEIIKIAKTYNSSIHTLIDGSQSVVHSVVNMQELNCDFFVFTGHKLYGPTGIGVLYGKAEVLDSMPPYQGGGDMIERVSFAGTTYKEPPYRFEAGTPAIIEVIGLGAAIDYVSAVGFPAIEAHEAELLAYGTKILQDIEGLKIYGHPAQKTAIFSFSLGDYHHTDVAMILDQQGIAVRSGHHCCMPLMQSLGIEGTLRASAGLYTNTSDLDALAAGLRKAQGMLS
jgi:cysteine desulfurase/selenocysteine lyase